MRPGRAPRGSVNARREDAMNEKFFALPKEKQERILRAGFRVFSQNAYRKCPVQEIALCAGISKSLLFHYFRNKKDLYLFLWDHAASATLRTLRQYGCYDPDDLFEMMERGMRAKLMLMREHPDMCAFAIKAFYEKDPEISAAIQESYRAFFGLKAQEALSRANPDDFIPGLDIPMMYREMYMASEGYLWEILQRGELFSAETLEADFARMLAFWKSIYLRRPGRPQAAPQRSDDA